MSGSNDTDGAAGAEGAPVLRVVRGTPSEEELAALVAVVSARGAEERPRSAWRDSARPGSHLRPGPGAWRRSMHPR